ncbi:transcription factor HES-4-B-like [Ixodes scapularis]|uniref:transcription factor HES-4-B-like n=1 Tax=Ixodes scapularis TaxID=6945 RepID=UPI001AD75589|nr:transcription factor HES-4-B-like [Ixodes scapularis]
MQADMHHPSSAFMRRKVMKPLMEKRRRARINHCLSELKRFLMAHDCGSFEKQNSRSQRVEKADILEMTVKYLRERQFLLLQESTGEEERTQRFHEGYKHCVFEVTRYADALEPQLRQTLLCHLQTRLGNLSARVRANNCPDQEPVSSTDGEPGRRTGGPRFDYGYETSSPTDVSEEDSSSECGDGPTDAEPFARPSQQEEPEDYRLNREQRQLEENGNMFMWRPW